MKDRMGKLLGGGTLASIVMVAFGVILLFWPEHTLELAARIVGIGLLICGALQGLAWGRDHGHYKTSSLTLAEAVVAIAAGILLLAAPKAVVSLVPITVGAIIVLNGLANVAQALDLKRVSYTRWQWPLVLGVLTVALGALVILNPLKPIEWAVMGIGLVLIFNGASNLWIGSRYRKYR